MYESMTGLYELFKTMMEMAGVNPRRVFFTGPAARSHSMYPNHLLPARRVAARLLRQSATVYLRVAMYQT
jgi:hypothetical protein